MIRRVAAALVALVAALTFGGVAVHADDAAPTSTLRLDVPLDPHTLMPLLTTELDEAYVQSLIFNPLVAFDGQNKPQPVLAQTVPTLQNGGISNGGKTVVVHLRKNVRWHDGVPFTASDVLFTIHAILDDRNNVINRVYYQNIASVTAPDASTVRFTLKTPQASFLSDVLGNYPIVPEHLLAKSTNFGTDPFNAQPVGTGPYKFVRWQRGDRIELEANPSYVLGAPKMKHIIVAIVPDDNTEAIKLQQHEIDYATVSSSVYNQMSAVPSVVRKTEPHNAVAFLALNQARPLMRDLAVRRAIAKAIDRKRLVQTVTHGVGIVAYGDLPLFMYDGHPPAGFDKADPAGARALLDEAGWKPGPDGIRVKAGVPLRLQYIDYNGSPSAASLDAQVIDMLRSVGIDIELKTFSTSMYFQPASSGGPFHSGHYDIAASGWSGSTDPTNRVLYSCATRLPGNNAANYCNPEMERLQDASDREYDVAKRRKIVAAIEDLAVRDATYVFVYYIPFRIIQNPALKRPLAGIVDAWYGISTWSLSTP